MIFTHTGGDADLTLRLIWAKWPHTDRAKYIGAFHRRAVGHMYIDIDIYYILFLYYQIKLAVSH